MFNCKIKYGDSSSGIYFPCSNNVLRAKFDELHIPEEDKPSAKIVVEEISYEPLKCLVNFLTETYMSEYVMGIH